MQHTEQAALRSAPLIRLLVAFKPIGWITRGLIAVTNAILPGKGMKSGPYTSDEMLRALADEAAEEDVIEPRGTHPYSQHHRLRRHGRTRRDGAPPRHGVGGIPRSRQRRGGHRHPGRLQPHSRLRPERR